MGGLIDPGNRRHPPDTGGGGGKQTPKASTVLQRWRGPGTHRVEAVGNRKRPGGGNNPAGCGTVARRMLFYRE